MQFWNITQNKILHFINNKNKKKKKLKNVTYSNKLKKKKNTILMHSYTKALSKMLLIKKKCHNINVR